MRVLLGMASLRFLSRASSPRFCLSASSHLFNPSRSLFTCSSVPLAGHSKWHNIRHKKAASDFKKQKVFSKLSRAITTAVREGGPVEAENPILSSVLSKAKAANMPKDTITSAIDKAMGKGADEYKEMIFEGYGPAGLACVVKCLSDSRNRTVQELRGLFVKLGGKMGVSGDVSYLFDRRGQITFKEREAHKLDEILEVVSEVAEDLEMDEEGGGEETGAGEDESPVTCIKAFTDYKKLASSVETLQSKGANPLEFEVIFKPRNPIPVILNENTSECAQLDFIEALEDLDDVQAVYHNASFVNNA